MPRFDMPMSKLLEGRVMEIVEQVTEPANPAFPRMQTNGREVRDGIRQRLGRMLEYARNEALEEAALDIESKERDGDDDIEGPAYSSGWTDAMRRAAADVRRLKRETK